MLTPSDRARYSRHLLLAEVGEAGQLALRRAAVAVVGTGGLGSAASIYLAAAGIGRLGLIDFDRVDVSNLQRQVLYETADVGREKVAAAAGRLGALNPSVEIETHAVALSSANGLEILGRYDVVLDGSDNFPTRYLVNDACVILGKPNVYGSVFRWEGQASVFLPDGPCYRCLYPEPPPPALVPNCAEAGVLGVLPGVIGAIQAAEAVKLVTGIGETLAGRLLVFDALSMSFREMKLRHNGHSHLAVTHLIDYEGFCNPMNITVKQLSERIASGDRDIYLLDVREPREWDAGHLEGAAHVPLQQVPSRMNDFPRDREIVVYCRSGARSANAQQFLKANGIANVRNLIGGVLAWKREIDGDLKVI